MSPWILRNRLPAFAVLLTALLGVSRISLAAAQLEHPVRSFEYHRYGSKGEFWTAARTPSGRIVASGSGLVELSGDQWRQLTREGSFDWKALYADTSGRVWAGAEDEIGVFEPDSSGALQYRSLTPLVEAGEGKMGDVWNILPEGRDIVFVGRGLVVRTNGVAASAWRIPCDRRLYGWIDGGTVFVGGKNGSVFRLDMEGPEAVRLPDALADCTDIDWAEGLGSDNWIADTEKGLFSNREGAPDRFERVNRLLRHSAAVSNERLDDGRLAIGTYYSGLILVDTKTGRFDQIDQTNGLLSAGVTGLLPGERGLLWVVTPRGLDRVSTSDAVSIVRDEDGLEGATAKAVQEDTEGVVVSTDSGRYRVPLASGGRVSKVTHLWFTQEASIGGTVVGGTPWGLVTIDGAEVKNAIKDLNVGTVVVSRENGHRLFYSSDATIHAAEENEGHFNVLASRQCGALIESIVESEDGSLWVAAGSTIEQLRLAATKDRFLTLRKLSISTAVGSPPVESRLFRVGSRVVALRGGMLLAVDAGSGELTPVTDLEDAQVIDAVTVESGELMALARPVRHMGESARLISVSEMDGRLHAQTMGTAGLGSLGALRNIHVPEGAPDRTQVWIGADGGMLRVKLNGLADPGSLPELQLTMKQTDSGAAAILPASVTRFPYGRRTLSFGWSAPDAVPGDLYVETRILGADENWTPEVDTATRTFAGLGDGEYMFEARVVDALGRSGPVVSRSFAILPPWYRSPLGVSGLGALALAFGLIGWQWKNRAAQRRAELLEGLVRNRTRELERVSAEKTRFIARMNHEIRNPLNGLLGALGVIEQSSHGGREGRMIQIVRACADHLSAVVEDVLDFANIEGGRVVIQERAYSVAELIESVPRMMVAESERTGTRVVTHVPPGMPSMVVGDPDRIRQILVNFLGNALKYAPGEPVQIEAAEADVENESWIRFAVRDHGPGISEADKALLFSMYERGRSAKKRSVRGMGIGLATCRLLARRMGGDVGVVSGLGEGSEFFLRLPLKAETAKAGGAEPPVAELHRLSCLVVEDQEFNRVILRDMLERLGCSVDESESAESAMNLAGVNRYDVVFTDLELPDAAPGEIVNQLMAQERPAGAPRPYLVVTTAYATENVRQTCLAAGAVAFLAKPLSQQKVLGVLRDIDAARRPAAAAAVLPALPPGEDSAGMLAHLARIRGCEVAEIALEVSKTILEEMRLLGVAERAANIRVAGQHAHRLLSLATLADLQDLKRAAVAVQNEARAGRMPSEEHVVTLAKNVTDAERRLANFTSGSGSTGARSRAQGHSESAASSRSD